MKVKCSKCITSFEMVRLSLTRSAGISVNNPYKQEVHTAMAAPKKATAPVRKARAATVTKAAPKPAPKPIVARAESLKPKRYHAIMVIEGIFEADSQEALNAITSAAQRAWEKPRGVNAVEVRAKTHVVSTRERGLPSLDA